MVFHTLLRIGDDLPQAIIGAMAQGKARHDGGRHYLFKVDPIRLTHAIADFTSASTGLGMNHYIRGFSGYLTEAVSPTALHLPDGGQDYRRRAAEDCGVGLACMLVNDMGVPWRNITQVPESTKLRARRPDFVALRQGQELVFEAKGTSDPSGVAKMISKAKEQLHAYDRPVSAKVAIASYVPMGVDDHLIAHTVAVDPPFDRTTMLEYALENLNDVVLYRVLRFAGLAKTARALAARIAKKEGPGPIGNVTATFDAEVQQATALQTGAGELRGALKGATAQAEFFALIDPPLLRDLLMAGKSIRQLENHVGWDATSGAVISSFDDATRLAIRPRTSPARTNLLKMAGLPQASTH